MQTATHTMPPPGRAKNRAWGLFAAILLQAGLIYALVVGLEIKIPLLTDHVTDAVVIRDRTKPVPTPATGQVTLVNPDSIYVPAPDFTIGGETGPGAITNVDNTPHPVAGAPDQPPLSIAATHTKPPYPALEERLGITGAVQLRLTVSAQGTVTDAVVVRSSGAPGLDRAAQAWVLAKWRYRPAMRGGVAVPATTLVLIKFDLADRR